MTTPLISVIVPTRDRPAYLQMAIKSILSQNFSSFELIVSDNSTNTESQKMIARFADERLKYVRQSGLLEMYDNWNEGLATAQGEFVILLSDDDYVDNNFLQEMAAGFDAVPEVGVVYCGCAIVNARGETQGRTNVQNGRILALDSILSYLNGDYASYPCSIMYRRSDILGLAGFNKERYGLPADVAAWMLIAVKYTYIVGIDSPLASYRLHGGNATLANNMENISKGLRNLQYDLAAHLENDVRLEYRLRAGFDKYLCIVLISLAALSARPQRFSMLQYALSLKTVSLFAPIRQYPKLVIRGAVSATFPGFYKGIKSFVGAFRRLKEVG